MTEKKGSYVKIMVTCWCREI